MDKQKLYATADIVAIPNLRTENPLRIHVSEVSDVSDVFDIPMDVAAMNQTAMRDVMNRVVARNVNNIPTPSIATKMSDISLSLPALPSQVRVPVLLKTTDANNKAAVLSIALPHQSHHLPIQPLQVYTYWFLPFVLRETYLQVEELHVQHPLLHYRLDQ